MMSGEMVEGANIVLLNCCQMEAGFSADSEKVQPGPLYVSNVPKRHLGYILLIRTVAHTAPGVLLPVALRRARCAVPGPVDEPAFRGVATEARRAIGEK